MPRVGRTHTITGLLMYTVQYGEIILIEGVRFEGGDFWTIGQRSPIWLDPRPPKMVRATGTVTGYRDMVVDAIEVVGNDRNHAAAG